ncbi:PREDICTED: tumor necrosis factor receptor superfamily member 4 [Ficedula albicollis]|uniref:tumor necrosis factor receptor superfamily member 4 n=1 Tax=Ficedula albicollis TaxID=59894 RepID=UPI0007AD829C|nr:PREDICTED: tumor necrosis factor receptor superfamily member 4 [Ficedula albicollis]
MERERSREGNGTAGMALPRIPWNFPPLCWLLLAVAIHVSLGLECQEHQYLLHGKCCSDCAPGQRMRNRCTAGADTVCSPCQDGYFSSQYHHGFCHSCTVCNARKGSVEVKPCEKTSDRVCVCQGIPVGNECSRCPEGTFSRGSNENCQPWTNCSFFGKRTLRAGTATEDAQCSSPGLDPIPTEFLKTRAAIPTEFLKTRAAIPTEFPETRAALPTELPGSSSSPRETPEVCSGPGSAAEPSWGSLSLLLLCLMLLMVSGISILLLIIQTSRKKTRNGPGRSLQHTEGSCRIPIQEQHIDSNCSLIK